MKKLLFIFISLFCMAGAWAQHSSPIKMLYQPRQNFITFSGAGGGNLYSLFKAAGSASGILGLDGVIKLGEDKLKEKFNNLKSLALTAKANFFNNTNLKAYDSLDIRRMVFQDNDFRFVMGARYNFLKEKKENPNDRLKTFATGFFDLIITPYRVDKTTTAYGNKGMTNISLNMGGKFGFLTKWGIGLFGITVNPQLDFLFIANSKNDYSLEEVLQIPFDVQSALPTVDLARSYFGIGTRIEIPLNDFAICFDLRKYFKMGPGQAIEGLQNGVVFSVGGMAIGSIFKNKDKEGTNKTRGGTKKKGK